ncbi:hypothetical protein BDN72DRAFT_882118 [Pluteus cervinus]|uniref:Uncharacterized protein n=1 Tax=Pluteus cervinus TaxID=181527 RepID=A0ACD3ADK5_9AGAR|nr:hypothetical protein BDN72DRAFT_882118 [Pluteus cervinus]
MGTVNGERKVRIEAKRRLISVSVVRNQFLQRPTSQVPESLKLRNLAASGFRPFSLRTSQASPIDLQIRQFGPTNRPCLASHVSNEVLRHLGFKPSQSTPSRSGTSWRISIAFIKMPNGLSLSEAPVYIAERFVHLAPTRTNLLSANGCKWLQMTKIDSVPFLQEVKTTRASCSSNVQVVSACINYQCNQKAKAVDPLSVDQFKLPSSFMMRRRPALIDAGSYALDLRVKSPKITPLVVLARHHPAKRAGLSLFALDAGAVPLDSQITRTTQGPHE